MIAARGAIAGRAAVAVELLLGVVARGRLDSRASAFTCRGRGVGGR